YPHILEIAKPSVEMAQGHGWIGRVLEPAILQQSRVPRAFKDGLRQQPRALGIERLGDRIFIEQGFDFESRAMASGECERRRHMADGERANTPFGLCRL